MIPYTVERRPDTGVTNVALGLWLFLASEVMLFGALFSAVALLRAVDARWSDPGAQFNLAIGLFHTAVLVCGTACVWRARTQPRRAVWLFASTLLALVFLATKTAEYLAEFSAGLRPADNTFLAMYFTLTGCHALHVVGGLVANLWVMAGLRRAPVALSSGRIWAMSMYWTFVDVVWLLVFATFYLGV
jgi:heme/copper-type cytochrome/quinol oxidase subunit 3